MTRPQKESDMKREHRVTIRLTDTEFSIIENTAEQADMTISEYMRKQIMEGQVNTKFEIVADVKEIKKLIGELGKIGSNLNQIARYFNQISFCLSVNVCNSSLINSFSITSSRQFLLGSIRYFRSSTNTE